MSKCECDVIGKRLSERETCVAAECWMCGARHRVAAVRDPSVACDREGVCGVSTEVRRRRRVETAMAALCVA